MRDEVLEFINRRFPQDCNWQNGNCYYFALILQDRFKSGKIVYDPVIGHFMFLYNNNLYDSLGLCASSKYYIWEDLEKEDALEYSRIVRDCIK